MILKQVKIREIDDSRGEKTLEAFGVFSDGRREVSVISSVPCGKSTGIHEVKSLDTVSALKKFEEIKSQIIGINFKDQNHFDSFLKEMDATTDKSNLGGNLILVLSLLFARGYSGIMEVDLSDYIRQIFEGNSINQFPRPIFNVINGGAHVKIPLEWKKKFGVSFPLDFQEFWVVPSVNDFALALSVGREFYHKLGRELEKIYGKEGLILGDEAGYTCPFKTNEEAFEIIQELINRHLYPLKMGLDAAASGFFNKNNQSYLIEGKEMTPEELTMLYYNLAHTYEIGFIEDPFHQEAFSDFARLYKEMPQLVVITDDLTTTNPQRLLEAILKKSANAILIKPNQIGTLSETLKVIALAYKNNWQVIVSHRSGETQDDFIADLAVGVGAFGLKAGSPETKFRMAKYLRALELWQKRN